MVMSVVSSADKALKMVIFVQKVLITVENVIYVNSEFIFEFLFRI